MYIEGVVVAAAVVWVAYLLWRVEKLKNMFKEIEVATDNYNKKGMELRRELIALLLLEDKRFLAKASAKTRDKILTEQAEDIKFIFENSIVGDQIVNGKAIPDLGVGDYLQDAFQDDTLVYLEGKQYDETNTLEIKNTMELKIKELD